MNDLSSIVIFIMIILVIDFYIIYDTNNLITYHHKISNGTKVVIIGSLHGDESAGSYAISQLQNELNTNKIQLKQGELYMYPFVNKYGCKLNCRNVPSLTKFADLNRIWYNDKKSEYLLIFLF